MSPLKAPDASRTGPTPPPRRRLSAPESPAAAARVSPTPPTPESTSSPELPEPPPPPPRSSTRLSQAAAADADDEDSGPPPPPPPRAGRLSEAAPPQEEAAPEMPPPPPPRRRSSISPSEPPPPPPPRLSITKAEKAPPTEEFAASPAGSDLPLPLLSYGYSADDDSPAVGGRLFDDLLSDAVPDGRLRAAEHALERAVIGAGPPAQDSPKGYDPSQLAWASMFRPGAAQRVDQLLSDIGIGSQPPPPPPPRVGGGLPRLPSRTPRNSVADADLDLDLDLDLDDGIGDELGDDWLAVGNPSPASSASSGGRQAAVPPLLSPRSSGRQASSSPQTVEPEVRDAQLQWMYRQERLVVAARADRSLDRVLQIGE